MNVGLDCREFSSYMTGISRILIEFLEEERKHKKYFDFILFGNQHTNFSLFQGILKDYRRIIIKEKFTFWWDQVLLKNAIEKNNIDVFFSPYYKVPLLTKIKTILSIFDVTYLLVKPYSFYFKNRFYIKYFIKLASKKAKKILTSSNYTKNDLIKILNLPQDKIEVIRLGVGSKFKTINDERSVELAKKKYGIYKKYILYVGNFKPHKNVKRLLEAYNLLPEAVKKEYVLVLCGGEQNKFEDITKSKGINRLKSIIYVGPVADEDLPPLYCGAELFIFPSLYEGFGLPPLEAMACGCPVASSNASSMPEILGDGCLYFDPYNVNEITEKIRLCLENKNLRLDLREIGLKRAKMFSVEQMTQQILSALDSVTIEKKN